MSRLIHTGIIGFGLSGRVFHAPFIHTHPGFHLAVVVERSHQHSKEIYPYISVVDDYQLLLQDDSLELVVVATPNKYHFSMARDCMLAGKHVVIEKPFAPSTKEADALIRIANETGKRIFVYQNRRWDGDFITIRKLINEGVLGNIERYEAHFDRYSPTLKPYAWRDENIPGGGNLFDLGSHLIDQALVLFGMPDALRAEIRAEREESPVDDAFRLEMFYPDNKAVLKASMLVKKPGPRYYLQGQEGRFMKFGIDPQEDRLKSGEMPDREDVGAEKPEFFGKLEISENSGVQTRCIETEAGNYMGFYQNVYDVLIKHYPMSVKAEEARDVIFIIEKAFESHKKNQVIKLNEKK